MEIPGEGKKVTLAGLGGVPITLQVAGHALTGDVTLSKGDVGLGSVTNDAQIKAADFPAAESVSDGQTPLFNGTGGKSLKASTLTGIIKETAGVPSAATAGTDYAGASVVINVVTSPTPTPAVGTVGANIQYNLTALAEAAAFAAPTGTPGDGQILIFRIKDNGTARALTYNAIYRPIGVTLPATTVIGKIVYIVCVYNAANTKWDAVSVAQEA